MDPKKTIRLLDLLQGLGFSDEAFVSSNIFGLSAETRRSIAIGDTAKVLRLLPMAAPMNSFSGG